MAELSSTRKGTRKKKQKKNKNLSFLFRLFRSAVEAERERERERERVGIVAQWRPGGHGFKPYIPQVANIVK